MDFLKKAFLKLYPKQPETSIGQLIAFSFLMIATFATLSFFTVGAEGILICSLLSSFIHATIAHDRHFRTGFLPPVIASFVLQFFFFISASDVYPWYVSLISIVLNLMPVAILAWIGAGSASWFIKRSKKKAKQKEEQEKKQRSQFSENIKRLSVLTLFAYLTMQVFVPFAARVSAAEKQSVDTFIKKYAPEKDYQPATEPIVPLPEGYQVETGANTGTNGTASSGKIPTWQQVQAQEAKAAKTSQQKKQQQTTEVLKKKNLSYKELQTLSKQGKITGAQMMELVNNGVSKGKISWWDGAKFYASGAGRAIQEVGTRIVKAVKPVVDWVVKHPVQSVLIAVAAVAVAAAIVFIPVVAAAAAVAFAWGAVFLSYAATAVTIVTAVHLGYSYLTGGTEGLKKAVFSEETFSLMAKGDIFGAIGSGAVDVYQVVDSLIPVAAIAKLPGKLAELPGFIGKVGRAIETVKEVKQIRIVITDSTGLLSGGGLTTLKRAFMTAIEEGPKSAKAMKIFAFNLVEDKQAVTLLNKAGAELDTAKQLGSKNLAPIVEKKADEVVAMAKGRSGVNVQTPNQVPKPSAKNYTPFNSESYRKMPLNWDKVVKQGTGETRIQHVRLHEVNDLSKPLHGVFNGDSETIVNNAWKNSSKAKVKIKSGTTEYIIPYKNAGWQGGSQGSGKALNHVMIVVEKNSNNIISAYPY